jgi:hypothetical protein
MLAQSTQLSANQQLRRMVSVLLLLALGAGFWNFGELVGMGVFTICDGNWKFNAVCWAILIVLGIPGLLLLLGHARRVASPRGNPDRAFWISSILYNILLITPPALMILSDPRLIGRPFDRGMLFIAAFPLVGIVLSSLAWALR